MRLIDADKLMLSLNDNYLANSPTGNETLAVQDYRESVCEGLEIAMATVEGAPTVGGWISVKDRLPKDFGEVITAVKYSGKRGLYVQTGEWTGEGWVSVWDDLQSAVDKYDQTHTVPQ